MEHKCKIFPAMGMALMSTLLLGACSKNTGSGNDAIVVSIEPEKYILEQLVGDRFDIITLMPNGNNPETYEASISDRKAVDDAAIYFSTGLHPFENNLTVILGDKANVVNISRDIDFIYGTHTHTEGHNSFLHTDDHSTPDPHIWNSVKNVRSMARVMTEALIQTDPDDSMGYRDRLKSFESRLDSIDKNIKSRLTDKEGTSFLIWHPSLSYFARDYGLKQIAVGSESKELSPKTLRAMIDSARNNNVKILFFQKEYDERQAESINTGVGSEIVMINPGNYDIESELETVTSALER